MKKKTSTYDPFLVSVELVGSNRSQWDMANRPVSGKEFVYHVCDRNFPNYNQWQFVVRVPDKRSRDKNIQVQPMVVPKKRIWNKLEYRVITFIPTSIGNHMDKYYCKVNLSDVSGYKTKQRTVRGERKIMPSWHKRNYFMSCMRLKQTVATTKGFDHKVQVMIVNPDDHTRMIRIFFANKIWVLQERYVMT